MARFIPDIVGLRAALDSKANAADVEKFDAKIEKKAEKVHGHTIPDVKGLPAALAGKSPITHRHNASAVTFTPSDPSDWDVSPAMVSVALNELSRRIKYIEENGSGGPSDRYIDGGAPDSVYLPSQVIDGGAPDSVYTSGQLIDGGGP
jgi:hypothetical protein